MEQKKMEKSLADQISDIAIKPVNKDFDIEDEENASLFQHNEKNGESDLSDYGNSNTEETKKAHYLEVEKSKLRAEKGLELNDPKYTGVKGSRQALYEEVSENEDEEEEEEEEDALSFRTDSKMKKRSMKERRIDAWTATKQAINKLSQSVQRDASKGYSILQQTKLFDNIIDLRIKLQKAVIAANKLPLTTESWEEAKMDDSVETKRLLKENEKLFNNLFNRLINFRIKFQLGDHITQNEEVAKHKLSKKDLSKSFTKKLIA
ncbi:ANM_HP_G0216970.mRNA.1.CDS.1 [Saccharomyces cerevisiae]|nr:ANM_HP_G0216970.mRNA.1.CDS.1 [Saccharomyces cerevisiae]CAI6977520.1 ANM_HP_G0216970.mRNA.1.CDS.1 [Saccharomyces cerevisiae]